MAKAKKPVGSTEPVKLSQDTLQIVAERLMDHPGICDIIDSSIFKLAKPGMLTVKGRYKNGEYKKHPFLGGELVRLMSVYGGKSGRLIFVFKPKTPSGDFQFIEIPEDHLDALEMFREAVDMAIGEPLTAFISNNVAPLIVEETKAEEERIDTVYGDRWGLFA
jgi:hypothetical protein